MSDTIVKTEVYFNLQHRVELATVEARTNFYARYYVIIKDGHPEFSSALIYGGSQEDVIRNTDSALQVVRQLLTETGFLTGEVVGA